MRKGKFLLSILAAAVFATVAGTLVACKEGLDLPDNGKNKPAVLPDTGKTYTVTFNAGTGATVKGITGGGTTMTTDKNGNLSGTMPTAEKNENNADYTFDGWGLSSGAKTPVLTTANFTSYQFKANTPVYAVFTAKSTPTPGPGPDVDEGYKITFNGGLHGVVSGQNEFTTVNGKVERYPDVDDVDDGWEFDYWMVNGEEIDDDYTFTEDTEVIAHYKEDENYDPDVDDATYYLIGSITEWGVDTDEKYVFTKTEDSYGKDQYLLTVELQANDVIKIVKGNKTQYISSWEDSWTFADIDTSDSEDNGNLTILEDGTYDIYLKVNKTDPDDTSVYVAKQGGGGGEEVTGAYVLGIGGEGHWNPADGEYPLEINPDNDYCTEYAAENVTVSAGEQIKFWLNGVYYAHLQEEPAVSEDVATGGGYTNDAGNITIVEEGTYNFYLKIYGEGNGAGSHDIWISKVGGGGNNDDDSSNFYLFGKMGGANKWSISAGGIKFVETELNPYEDGQVSVKYKAEADLIINDEVKIFKSNDGNAWNYSNFEEGSVGVNCELTSDGNIKIKRAGHYTVYLRMHKDGSNSVRVFYVAPQPENTDTAKLNNTAMIDESATRIPADADREKLVKWYVLENVQLQANTKIKFYVNDQEVSGLFRVSSQLINGGVSGDNTMGVEFTMPKAGTFEFHLKYYIGEGWKVWIHGTLDNPTPPIPDTDPNASLTYGSATVKFADNNTVGGYVVGKFTAKNHTAFNPEQWNNGYKMTFDESTYHFKLTVYLKVGDIVKVRVNDAGVGFAKLTEANKNSLNGIASTDSDDNFVIEQAGYYSFDQWWVNNVDEGGMEVTYSATKPNGGNEGGGGNQGSKDIAGYVYKDVNSSSYFLVGGFVGEDFDWNNGYEMKTKDNGEYMVEGFTVTAGSGVKIRIGDENFGYDNVHAEWGNKDWVEVDNDGNIVFKEGGTYKIYINPDSKDIYISK